MAKECIFCKIVDREIPTDFLYEDDQFVVFRDINPKAPVHLLVVPRKHIRSINDLADDDRDLMAGIFYLAREMAKKEGIDQSGYRLFFNVEKGGGQEVFHLHLHLIGGWK